MINFAAFDIAVDEMESVIPVLFANLSDVAGGGAYMHVFGIHFLVIGLVIAGIVSAVIWAVRGGRRRGTDQAAQESEQERIREEQQIEELVDRIRYADANSSNDDKQ